MNGKIFSGVFLLLGTSLLFTPPAGPAQEPEHEETKQLMSFVKEAAALWEGKGAAACVDFKKKGSQWFRGDTYVFVSDLTGISVCHPANPGLEGTNQLDLKDAGGKPIIRQFLKVVSSDKHQGWVHYQWPKPGEPEPSWKTSYVVRVRAPSGVDYLVGSGRYDMKTERMFIVDQVERAVEMVKRKGRAAFDVLRDKTSEFIFGEVYVFVLDEHGTELVNPASPELEGQSTLDYQDPTGQFVTREMINMLKSREAGWINYMWPKPGETTPSRKSAYIQRVRLDGKKLIIGSGLYVD